MSSKEAIEQALVRGCIDTKTTLATAESCTGGLIASCITDVPGASAIFLGGVVAYANAIKTALLGVDEHDLLTFGAVSESVVKAMAVGARRLFHADLAVAVSGIAGPGGGAPEKPVGTVYLAAVSCEKLLAQRCYFDGDRQAVKEQTVHAALTLLVNIQEQ